MGSAILFNAAHMQEIEDGTVTSGLVDVSGNLILTKHDGSTVDAGHVVGADGIDGIDGEPGSDGEPGPAGPLLLGVAYPWMSDVVPTWGLELNGQTIPDGAITYSGLAGLYSSWVDGDDLVLPDWRGHVPVGYKSGDSSFGTMGVFVGAKTHTLITAEMPSHAHTLADLIRTTAAGTNQTGTLVPAHNGSPSANQQIKFAMSSSTGGDGAHNNIQPSVVVKWIVCAATSSGDFDTEVQTALVNRMGDAEADINDLAATSLQPVVPVSIASTGSVATLNSTTGAITVPAGCTSLRVNGCFAVGYEYLIRTRENDSFTAFTNVMSVRFRAAGVTNSSLVHNLAGRWTQYDGTNGIFNISGGSTLNVGYGYTSGGVVHREITVYDAAEARDTVLRFWNYVLGAARETIGTGSYNGTSQFDGFELFPATGSFAGSVRIYRRLALV